MAETSPQDAAATERLHQYWVHGEGAAKIRWGEPNDFARCVMHLGKFIRDPQGYCNLAHHAALGIYPATHAAMEKKATGRSAVTTPASGCDGDGLDASWDGDLADLPDMTGLQMHHFDAAAADMGMNPPDAKSSRALPRLGSGARFKKLSASLAAKGAHDPGALAAWIGRRKFGKAAFHKLASAARKHAGGSSGRAESLMPYFRSFPLEDIHVRSSGDGRTVEAYAAVFGVSTEVRDQDGHYTEEIHPAAFNKAISDAAPQGSRRGWKVGVFYNHGMTIHGTPSERGAMPVGVPLEITADSRGLKTVTRYHRGEFCDEILDRIREGSLPGYSFTGNFRRSRPMIPRGGFRPDYRTGTLPHVRRVESTLMEYGPTPFPIYADAAITAMRGAPLLGAMAADPELASRMLSMLSASTPSEPLAEPGTPLDEEQPPRSRLVHSGRPVKQEIQAARSAFLQRQHRR